MELLPGEGFCCPCVLLVPPDCTERLCTVLSFPLCPQLADVESSPSKEEDEDDDDTMQNTVVLFSNTDKFVLMQVTRAWRDGQTDRVGQTLCLLCQPLSPHSQPLPTPGHVRGVRQLRAWGRGASPCLLPVLPVLPPLLCQQQGEERAQDPWSHPRTVLCPPGDTHKVVPGTSVC